MQRMEVTLYQSVKLIIAVLEIRSTLPSILLLRFKFVNSTSDTELQILSSQ